MPSARRVKWAKFRIGVMAVAGLSILGVLCYLLLGSAFWQPRATLRVYAPDATALGRGAAARVNGIFVGKVHSVRLAPSAGPARVVEILFTVDSARLREIPVDSTAQISPENALGGRFLDLTRGASREHIRAGSEIRYQPSPELLKTIDLSEFQKNLRQIDALLADIEHARSPAGQLLVGGTLYEDARRRLAAVHEGLRAATSVTGPAGELLYRAGGYRRLREAFRRLDTALGVIEFGQGGAGRFLRDPAPYEALLTAIAQVRETMADANAGRGPLGALAASDTAWRDWNLGAASLARWVDDAHAGSAAGAQLYETLEGAGRGWGDALRDFRVTPRKFMRLRLF